MAGAQLERGPDRQRQEARSGGDAVLLHDYGAIVKRQSGLEDRKQEVTRDVRIQRHAAFDEGAESDITLENDERADLLAREMIHREQDFAERLRSPESPAEAEPV